MSARVVGPNHSSKHLGQAPMEITGQEKRIHEKTEERIIPIEKKKDKKVTDGATDDSGLRIALDDEGASTKRVQSEASDLEEASATRAMPGVADGNDARLARALLPASPWKVALVIVTLSLSSK